MAVTRGAEQDGASTTVSDVATGPPSPPAGGARRIVLLVAPLVVVALLVVVGAVAYQAGAQSSGPAVEDVAPPNTLKPQEVDMGFAADMVDHHEQAVQMSLMVLDKATLPAVRAYATKIAVGQRREVGIFQQFMADRGQESSDPRRTVMAWMDEPTPYDQMPGMASSEELVALNAATGIDADKLFLDLMIRHHDGGVHMADYAAEHAETQSMRDLAARISFAQKGEINDLELLRAELGD